VQTLQGQPTDANLAVAKQDWRDMRVSWEISESFLFGPVEDLNIDDSIDNWPVSLNSLEDLLRPDNKTAINEDSVSKLPSNEQGFHGVEYILFGNGVNGPNKTAAELTPRQLSYLVWATKNLSEHTGALAHAWTTNADPDVPSLPAFSQFLSTPGPRNPKYKSEGAAMSEVVNGILTIANEVGTGKIAEPENSQDPSQVESPFSWNSLTDFSNNIRSVLNVVTGSYNGHGGPGLQDFINTQNPALTQKIVQQTTAAIAAIEAIAGPEHLDFRQAIKDPAGRQRCDAARAAVAQLEATIRHELLPLVQDLD
jgi:putative iron-regulated protein